MKNHIFPPKVSDKYWFKKELAIARANYLFAVYSDKKGNNYFGKFWNKEMGSSKKKYLINEINALKYMSENSSSDAASMINIPKVKHYDVSEKLCFYLSDFVKGKDSTGANQDEQIKQLEKAIDFFHKTKVKNYKRYNINVRSANFYLFSFPYIFLKALLNFPGSFLLFFISLARFYNYSPGLYKRPMVLNHRDLNLRNFILNGKRTYIIDFQLFALTVPEFEYSSIVRSIIGNGKLTSEFMRLLRTKYLKSDSSVKSFKAMLIYYAIMGLTDKKHPNTRIRDFKKTLKFVKTI
jgi:hypothetical protein